jgi:hypothetical protein
MVDDATLSVPEGWTEVRFGRDAFGPDERAGIRASFERASALVEVIPVRYRRQDGVETVRSLTETWTGKRTDPGVPRSDVGELTAFATRLTYTPFDTNRQEIVCVAADADDALAVALWLLIAAEDAEDLHRHVTRHAGQGSPTGASPSDDHVLAATYSEAPDRCVYRATGTDDHRIELPYRYAPVLSGARRTGPGVPRFPSTVRGLAGLVSEDAWAEHGLDDLALDAPIERDGPGEYQLAADVADAVAGTDAGSYALVRLGESPESGQ